MQEVPLPVYTAQDEKIARLEALVYRLLGDYSVGASLMGPFPSADSVVGLRHAGSHYHLSNTLNSRPAFTTGATAADYLVAVPFYVPAPCIVDRIALEVTTGAAGSARLGIYSSDRNLYPGRLLLDAGTVSTTATGVKAVTIRHGLTRGLKWLAAVFDATPTLRKMDFTSPGCWAPLGTDPSTWAYYGGWLKAFSYAALPAKYPSGGSKWTTPTVLMLRFAA